MKSLEEIKAEQDAKRRAEEVPHFALESFRARARKIRKISNTLEKNTSNKCSTLSSSTKFTKFKAAPNSTSRVTFRRKGTHLLVTFRETKRGEKNNPRKRARRPRRRRRPRASRRRSGCGCWPRPWRRRWARRSPPGSRQSDLLSCLTVKLAP